MTTHFFFFLLDGLSWISIGLGIGSIIFINKRIAGDRRKISFLVLCSVLMFFCGIFTSLVFGLPDKGYALYDTEYAIILTTGILFVLNPSSREYLLNQIRLHIKYKLISPVGLPWSSIK